MNNPFVTLLKSVAAIIGAALLVAALFSNELAKRFAPALKASSVEEQTAKFVQRGILPKTGRITAAGTTDGDDVKLSYVLRYPKQMMANQAQAVALIFDRTFDRDEKVPRVGDDIYESYNAAMRSQDFALAERILKSRQTTLQRPPQDELVSLMLTSSAFDITPNNGHSIPNGTQLPVEMRWTVTPTVSGNQALLLDVSGVTRINDNGIAFFHDRKIESTAFTINDKPHGIPNSSILGSLKASVLEFPVTVQSAWGVTPVIENLVRGMVALFGLLLWYPLLVGLKNPSNTPSKHRRYAKRSGYGR